MAQSHYVSTNGEALDIYEKGYVLLQSYFGEAVPKKITVEFRTDNVSRFEPRWSTVLISSPRKSFRHICTVTHESSHLAIFNFTDGASLRKEFRFFDEGFASIIEYETCDALADYKQFALRTAQEMIKDKGVSFEKVQDWTSYFGSPQTKMDFRSYQVGSTFNFYIIDTYGKDKLLAFFKAVGDAKNLDKALQAILEKDQATIEKEWLTYIAQELPAAPAPKIVRLSPANNAQNVPLDLAEIEVEFDLPMQDRGFLVDDCSFGLCNKEAYWKSMRVLAVKANLQADHDYRLGLGSQERKIFFKSYNGIPLPFEIWQFKTAEK